MAEDNQQVQQQTHEIWPSKADKEQSYRNAHVLPCLQGGGVIFPGGLLGSGFRIDQETLERYHADRNSGTKAAQKWGANIYTAVFVMLFLFFLLGMFFGRERIAATPLYWVDITSLVAVVGLVVTKLSMLGHNAQQFLLSYASVASVRPGAFLRRRLLGLMAAGVHNYWRSLYSACGLLFVGFNGVYLWDLPSEPWSLTLLFASVAFAGALHLCLVLAHIMFRLRHGRAPNPEDLKPVHYQTTEQT